MMGFSDFRAAVISKSKEWTVDKDWKQYGVAWRTQSRSRRDEQTRERLKAHADAAAASLHDAAPLRRDRQAARKEPRRIDL